jgi:hypothetical protein
MLRDASHRFRHRNERDPLRITQDCTSIPLSYAAQLLNLFSEIRSEAENELSMLGRTLPRRDLDAG